MSAAAVVGIVNDIVFGLTNLALALVDLVPHFPILT